AVESGRVHLRRSHPRSAPGRAEAVPEGLLGPVSPVPATLVLASVTVLALAADRLATLGVLAALLLAACSRAPASRRRPYLLAILVAGASVFVVSPFLWSGGGTLLWEGPTVPVLGILDVTSDELYQAALSGLRLVSVGLAFA